MSPRRTDTRFLLGAALALAGLGAVSTVLLTGWMAWFTQLVLVLAVASAIRAHFSINELLERARQDREALNTQCGESLPSSGEPGS